MKKTFIIANIGIFSALSIVLVMLIHIPIFPAVGFLEYDPADIPIFLCTSLFGPWYGLLMTAVVCVVQGLTVSGASGIYGIIMHFIATGTFTLVLGLITKKNKSVKRTVIGYIFGVIVWMAAMFCANLIVTPIFMNAPVTMIMQLMPWILAFNLIKSVINASISYILYIPVSTYYKNRRKI